MRHILKNKQNNKCVFIYETIQKMKMKIKMENRSHKCDINRPRSRHGHKYSKYRTCPSMMCLYVLSNT